MGVLDLPNVTGQLGFVADADWRAPVAFAVAGAPADLTGIAFRAQMRSAPGDPTIWLDLSTDVGGLVNGGATGVLSIFAPAAMTRFVPPGSYVLDIVAEAGGDIVNLCGASPFTVAVTQGVTVP